MQRKISDKPGIFKIIFIILISTVTALVFNYLNPEGLTLLNLNKNQASGDLFDSGNLEFVKPIFVQKDDAYLLFSNKVHFIDIRSTEEYRTGHIPNSINLPMDYVKDAEVILEEIPKETPMVLYGSNTDSLNNTAAAENIFSSGYKKLYIFNGGIEDWTNSGYEVVR